MITLIQFEMKSLLGQYGILLAPWQFVICLLLLSGQWFDAFSSQAWMRLMWLGLAPWPSWFMMVQSMWKCYASHFTKDWEWQIMRMPLPLCYLRLLLMTIFSAIVTGLVIWVGSYFFALPVAWRWSLCCCVVWWQFAHVPIIALATSLSAIYPEWWWLGFFLACPCLVPGFILLSGAWISIAYGSDWQSYAWLLSGLACVWWAIIPSILIKLQHWIVE